MNVSELATEVWGYSEWKGAPLEKLERFAALVRVEALAEPVNQEPVGVISESAIGLVKLHSNGVSLPFGTQLYAAPVDAKAIRAEALEEAAKVCRTAQAQGLQSIREAIEEAIRGLK